MSIPFKSAADRALELYISHAKSFDFFLSGQPNQIEWDTHKWTITHLVKRTKSNKVETVAFHHAERAKPKDSDLIGHPMRDVIKAFIAYRIKESPRPPHPDALVNGYIFQSRVLRSIDIVLRDTGFERHPSRITLDILNLALERLPERSQRNAGIILRNFARELDECNVTMHLKGWSHPALTRNSGRISRVNPSLARKSLSPAEVACLAEAYRRATSDMDRVCISIIALLCCSPSRREEALILHSNVEVFEGKEIDAIDDDVPFHKRKSYKSGLRWWPVKGGRPQVKFVPKEMVQLAREALATIRRVTDPARKLAAWLAEHPGQIYLPDALSHVKISRLISIEELSQLIPNSKDWVKRRKIKAISIKRGSQDDGMTLYSWAAVEAAMLGFLPLGWPNLSDVSKVEYKDALCTIFYNQFNDRHGTQAWMVEAIDGRHLEIVLTGRKGTVLKNGVIRDPIQSIFERLDIKLPNGDFPHITSHQVRHYLNTIAQRAKVPQAHIAHWSGRKNVMQNDAYDHSDMLFEVEAIKAKGKDPVSDDLKIKIVDDSDVTTLSYLSADMKLQIHSTPYGYCTRSLIQEPCDRAGACTTCTRLVCLGGSKRSADLLQRDAARDRISIRNLNARRERGQTINERAATAIEMRATRSEAMAQAIMEPHNFGALIANMDFGPLVGFSHDNRIADSREKLLSSTKEEEI